MTELGQMIERGRQIVEAEEAEKNRHQQEADDKYRRVKEAAANRIAAVLLKNMPKSIADMVHPEDGWVGCDYPYMTLEIDGCYPIRFRLNLSQECVKGKEFFVPGMPQIIGAADEEYDAYVSEAYMMPVGSLDKAIYLALMHKTEHQIMQDECDRINAERQKSAKQESVEAEPSPSLAFHFTEDACADAILSGDYHHAIAIALYELAFAAPKRAAGAMKLFAAMQNAGDPGTEMDAEFDGDSYNYTQDDLNYDAHRDLHLLRR